MIGESSVILKAYNTHMSSMSDTLGKIALLDPMITPILYVRKGPTR